MNVCHERPGCGRVVGVVRRARDGFPSWESRHRGSPARSPEMPGRDHRDTQFVKLRGPWGETSTETVQGYCKRCRLTISVSVADLVRAYEEGQRVVLV